MADRPAPKCVAISPGEVAEPNVVRTADPTRLRLRAKRGLTNNRLTVFQLQQTNKRTPLPTTRKRPANEPATCRHLPGVSLLRLSG